MTHDAAIKRLVDYVEHSLNGVELSISLKQYEVLAVIDLTPILRNRWRQRVREAISAYNEHRADPWKEPVPRWARQDEL